MEEGGGRRRALQVASTLFSLSSTGVCCTQSHVVVHKVTRTRPSGGGLGRGRTEKSGNIPWEPTWPLEGRQQPHQHPHPWHPMRTQSKSGWFSSDLRLVARATIRMDNHVQGTLGRYGHFQVQKQVALRPSSQSLAHSSTCDWPNELLVFAKYSPQVGSVLKTALVPPSGSSHFTDENTRTRKQ